MKRFILGFLTATALLTGGYWVGTRKGSRETPVTKKASQQYHCPMHPAYVSDKPGDCPICGMRLVPTKREDRQVEHATPQPAASGPQKERKVLYYVDPMNPQHRSEKPGKAPDGMDLVPVYADEVAGETAKPIPGYVPVKITAERQQMMGITLDEARVIDLEQNINTIGRVSYNETRLYHIHTKFEGFIEEIFVDFVGKFVRKGDPLFSVYSPELMATQKEYLLALRAKDQFPTMDSNDSLMRLDLVEAARQRLSLWDIEADQITQLEKSRQPIKAVTIYSPVSGFVNAKTALQGMRIMPADNLYEIIDLSTVWVLVDVYEGNLPFVRVGQPAEMRLPYQPGKVWKGKVTYLNPALEEKTRTAKVRLEFANPSMGLKPEMYADILLKGSLGKAVAVPESAVLSTGERMMVFVSRGEGVFEPREVTTGVKVRNYYEIKVGVSAGEKVVTGANFLLDSESKLKAALSGVESSH